MAEFLGNIGQNIFGNLLGLNTPLKRFALVTLAGVAGEYYVKPTYAFNEDGSLRKWKVVSSDPGSTAIPLGLIPFVGGTVSALYF